MNLPFIIPRSERVARLSRRLARAERNKSKAAHLRRCLNILSLRYERMGVEHG